MRYNSTCDVVENDVAGFWCGNADVPIVDGNLYFVACGVWHGGVAVQVDGAGDFGGTFANVAIVLKDAGVNFYEIDAL